MTDSEKIEIRKYSEDIGLPYEFIKFSKSTVSFNGNVVLVHIPSINNINENLIESLKMVFG